MKRRDFVKTAGVGGAVAGASLAASAFPTPAIAQGVRELKMVTAWPKNFPGLGTGAETLAKRVAAASDGKLTVRVFAAGELVPAFQAFDAVSSGNADMSHSASYYWQGKSPAFNFFTSVPFGLTADEHYSWIWYGGGIELWREVCKPFGVTPFLRASTGVQMGGWYRKEINSLDDYKGLKFRMPGLGGEVLRRLGATVVNLPGGEIFPALQAGTIDGTEWVGPWHDMAFGFYKVAQNYYWPGWHEPCTTGEVLINTKVWESLPQDQQAMLEAIIQAEAAREFAEYAIQNSRALKTLIDQHGVKLQRFPDELLTQIGTVAGEVVKEVGTQDPMTTKVYESFMDFRSIALGWTKIGEQAYLNARTLSFQYG